MHVKQSVQQFRLAQTVQASQKDKKRASIVYSHKEDKQVIDTLGTAVDNFVGHVEGLGKEFHSRAELLYQDLIEPLNLSLIHI